MDAGPSSAYVLLGGFVGNGIAFFYSNCRSFKARKSLITLKP